MSTVVFVSFVWVGLFAGFAAGYWLGEHVGYHRGQIDAVEIDDLIDESYGGSE